MSWEEFCVREDIDELVGEHKLLAYQCRICDRAHFDGEPEFGRHHQNGERYQYVLAEHVADIREWRHLHG